MGIGGMGSVRGYPLSAYQGDRGYHLSAGVHGPFPMEDQMAPQLSRPEQGFFCCFLCGTWKGLSFVKNARRKWTRKSQRRVEDLKSVSRKTENKSPGLSFAVTYGAPVFDSILPADKSYGTVYLNGMINY